ATVSAAVLRRIRPLPAPAVEAVKVASVLGRRFSVDQLATVMGRSAVALMPALDDALAVGVLADESGELAFRHELIREAVYADIPFAVRRGLHRDAARVLAAHGAAGAQVAEHLLAGADPGDRDAAARQWEAARTIAPRSPQT